MNSLKNAVSLAVLPFFMVLYVLLGSLRPDDLGHDFATYRELFNEAISPDAMIFPAVVEPGYIILAKFINFLGGGFYSFVFFMILGSVIFKGMFVRAFSKKPWVMLCYFLLYFLSFYSLFDLNQLRICVAVSFLLVGFSFKQTSFFLLFLFAAIFTHYSLAPIALLALISRLVSGCMRVNKFRCAILISLLLLPIILKFVSVVADVDFKYAGINYPYYYYYFHPYSVVMAFALFYLWRPCTKSVNFLSVSLYFSAFISYMFFVAFIMLEIQVAAFRYVELALFFMFNLLFYLLITSGGWRLKNLFFISSVLGVVILYSQFLSQQPIVDFNVLLKWIELS